MESPPLSRGYRTDEVPCTVVVRQMDILSVWSLFEGIGGRMGERSRPGGVAVREHPWSAGCRPERRVASFEVHVSLIREPNSKFLGYVTPKSGTGKDMADSILEIFKDREQNKQLLNFTAVGCYGTVENTGYKNDGKTEGPNEFKGEIGQQLENCASLPVITFLPIENNLPLLEDKNDLSTDQKYLLDMCIAASSGNC
ncbi:hypothetical protein HNY73_010756 [Argiope bruennichi]|uniref:Uncharacterized protein n=1 Tax=Argiope bruennichi TaxID=94029 RepID=A0A8T0F401_ARGBR|nr:hypothetical protein HNY73_010756 [Argiope bruennichi]